LFFTLWNPEGHMLLKRIQLGLIHVAVAMTLVPINSTLNRVMINELAISATVVAMLASLPYLFAPMQVAIGAYSDRHPVFGLRRTPYIVLGLILCVTGVVISPLAAYTLASGNLWGYVIAVLAFGAWGMGYNLSSVSYLSLADDISKENERGKTIAVMWFMMIVGIIFTAIAISRMVDPYTPAALERSFLLVGGTALILGLLGLIRLEPSSTGQLHSRSYTIKEMTSAITANPVAKLFFIYLWLLLAAILGQDILLEPFGAQAFGMTVRETTRITSLWGVFVLAAILAAGALERRVARRSMAQTGNVGALLGFLIIIASGGLGSLSIFYTGVALLGIGTGLSTVANLSLMFDLTVPEKVGLFIGAWGLSNALSRLTGSVLGGVVRDVVTQVTGELLSGYMVAFGIEAGLMVVAILMLSRIDVAAFRRRAEAPSIIERAAMTD
jgi:BCD family chlorophyll transporter-like MFS transporter